MTKPADLVQGTLDLLVLRAGPGAAARLGHRAAHPPAVAGGAARGKAPCTPALHKLEHHGWIDAEWALSDNNRRAKYYRLTPAGRRALKSEAAEWERLSAAIASVLKPV